MENNLKINIINKLNKQNFKMFINNNKNQYFNRTKEVLNRNIF